jgi:hypothetical protein
LRVGGDAAEKEEEQRNTQPIYDHTRSPRICTMVVRCQNRSECYLNSARLI